MIKGGKVCPFCDRSKKPRQEITVTKDENGKRTICYRLLRPEEYSKERKSLKKNE